MATRSTTKKMGKTCAYWAAFLGPVPVGVAGIFTSCLAASGGGEGWGRLRRLSCSLFARRVLFLDYSLSHEPLCTLSPSRATTSQSPLDAKHASILFYIPQVSPSVLLVRASPSPHGAVESSPSVDGTCEGSYLDRRRRLVRPVVSMLSRPTGLFEGE